MLYVPPPLAVPPVGGDGLVVIEMVVSEPPISQSSAVSSVEPVKILFPSLENATELTALVCPWRIPSIVPSSTFQTLAVLSADPVTMKRPSDEKATLLMLP